LAAVLTPAVMAQGVEEGPGRGVARISIVAGDVSVRRGDTAEWVAAAVNAPLVTPDSVLTGTGSRAEVQLDWANMVRVAPKSEVRFSELEENRYQVQIVEGTVTFSMVRDTRADVDLSTPNVSVRPFQKGRYRVAVHTDGTTEVTVRSGEAEIYTPQGTEILKSGKTMLVRGTLADPEYRIAKAIPKDAWDEWNRNRDKQLRGSQAYQYVSSDIYGAEELDGYGQWVYAPTYGYVWRPRVAVGWAPYRYGRWGWVDWYGWSWISHDPWGWAPYHYGRWFNYPGYGWCWWPGARHHRHYWSPGLVAFFGYGSGGFNFGFSIGVGHGHIGWVPLAPHERYHRWYGRGYYRGYRGGNTYIDNSVNIVNNVNIRNTYKNAKVRNGITSVEGGRFGRGTVRNTYREGQVQNAHLVRGQLPVVPGRESTRMTDRQASVTRGATRASRTGFYSRRQTASTERVSFADQQRGMERVVRQASRGGNSGTVGRSTARSGAVSGRAGQQSATAGRGTSISGSGWRRVAGSTAGTSRSTATRSQTGTVRSRSGTGARSQTGWRTFGQPEGGTRAATRSTTGRTPTAGATRGGATRGASRSTGTSSSGWERFGQTRQTPATSRGRGTRSSQPSAERRTSGRSSGGWSTFERRSQPRSGNVTSRDRSSSGGSRSTSGSAARSQRRSMPSATRSTPPSRSSGGIFGGSGRTRSSGGYSRGSSRPSMGSSPTMRAPSGRSSGGGMSRPSRSSGGSRGMSAPSRGGGGASRGASAPSRGSSSGSRGGGSRPSGRGR